MRRAGPALVTLALTLCPAVLSAQQNGGTAASQPPAKPACAEYGVCSTHADEKVTVSTSPRALSPRPTISGRSVFIDQVGDGNVATVVQTAAQATATIGQTGVGHYAAVTQSGAASSAATVAQNGGARRATLIQDGVGGNAATLTQHGAANSATLRQTGSGGENVAALAQNGTGNALSLVQQGSDNQAALTQNGEGNTMTVAQLGAGNRLAWTQTGDHLSNLAVSQYGGQALQITQSR